MLDKDIPKFLFYGPWLDSVEDLETDEERYQLQTAILYYGARQEEIELTYGSVKAAFKLIKRQIDNTLEKYNKNKQNGYEFGRPKTTNDERIYELAIAGMKAKQIALELGISENTVYKSEGWKNR